MSETQFSVSWQAYQKSICNGLSFLQQREEFVDMTIAADGHLVKVHRMVMSLVSPYLKELITSAQCPHPVIFLNRVSYSTLKLILEYAYTGEVLVERDSLDEFLQVCNTLHIKGFENMSKPVKADAPNVGVQFEQSKPQDKGAPVNLSQLSSESVDQISDDQEDIMDDITQMDQDDDDECIIKENTITDKEKLNILDTSRKQPSLQYTISKQGSIQLIVNRYIYRLNYTRKDNSKAWRCTQRKCLGTVTTKGNKVIHRMGAHNHTYRDSQILKRVRNNNIFSVEPQEHEIATKCIFDKANEVTAL